MMMLENEACPLPSVTTVSVAEREQIAAALLAMPVLYQLFGGAYDPVRKEVNGAKALYVVYIPFATGASTGLSEKPSGTQPWLMFPGTPKAHIMFTPAM